MVVTVSVSTMVVTAAKVGETVAQTVEMEVLWVQLVRSKRRTRDESLHGCWSDSREEKEEQSLLAEEG